MTADEYAHRLVQAQTPEEKLQIIGEWLKSTDLMNAPRSSLLHILTYIRQAATEPEEVSD